MKIYSLVKKSYDWYLFQHFFLSTTHLEKIHNEIKEILRILTGSHTRCYLKIRKVINKNLLIWEDLKLHIGMCL